MFTTIHDILRRASPLAGTYNSKHRGLYLATTMQRALLPHSDIGWFRTVLTASLATNLDTMKTPLR